MPSFIELQTRLSEAKFKKTILTHLIEHLDSNFLPIGEHPPKLNLLTDDKTLVPKEAFDEIVSDILTKLASEYDEEIAQIHDMTVDVKKEKSTKEGGTHP